MRTILDANQHDLALLIGNGINRYGAPVGTNAWEELLTDLARSHLDPTHQRIPKGVSPTEFFDVLEMALDEPSGPTSLQAQFCQQMATWMPLPQHHLITAWAHQHRAPILTTNFDDTLARACGATLRRCGKDAFTAFYPWGTCHALDDIADPLTDFAIWHIHGMQRYRQSIRLGLSHYMGSVERARGWLHKSGTKLFAADDIRAWPGADSWLQVFLHKPLLIFGFGLGENEVFVRWLLIERAKYFKKLPARRKPGWYVHVDGSPDIDPGKALFLKGMGITPIQVADFDDIYGDATWR